MSYNSDIFKKADFLFYFLYIIYKTRGNKTMRYQDRNEFRKSEEWRNFRNQKAEEQEYKDYITGQPLQENWNLHHLDLNHSHYFDISDKTHFVCLNKKQHNEIHRLFLLDWKNMKLDEKTVIILTKMDELNKNNIEPLLFSCHIEYDFDHTNKTVTQSLTKRLLIPCDKYGMVYWNPNTPGADKNQPLDSNEWAIYMTKKNNYSMKGVIYAMQLRHLCLYSSLKNIIRPEVKAKWNIDRYNETKNKLEKELKKTTLWLLKYKK